MGNPGARCDRPRDLGYGAIRHTHDYEVGVADVEFAADRPRRDLLLEAGGDSLADASRADDAC